MPLPSRFWQILMNEDLNDLPLELAMCESLHLMSVEGCPLSRLPAEITAGGPSSIFQVCRNGVNLINILTIVINDSINPLIVS